MSSKYFLVLMEKANATWHVLAQPSPFFRKIETDVDCHGDGHGADGPTDIHHA